MNAPMVEIRRLVRPGTEGIKIGPFGSALRAEHITDRGYKVYGQENVIDGSFDAGKRYINHDKFRELRGYEIGSGDVLVTMMGTAGKCIAVPDGIERGIMDSHLLRLRPNLDLVDPRYIVWLINDSAHVAGQLESLGRGSTMHGLNSSIVKCVTIPVPHLALQRAIADFLDRRTAVIDEFIVKKERLVALLAERRQALITQAVTKGLDLRAAMKDSGVPFFGLVPAHWTVTRLKHLSPQITVGIVVTPAKYYVDEGVPCPRSLNVKPGRLLRDPLVFISPEANRLHAKSIIRKGDLVCVRTGQPGTTAVVDDYFDGANCIDLIIIRRSATFSSDYLRYFMNSTVAHHQYGEGSEGALQQHFNVETAGNLLFPRPPREEQDAITQALARVEDTIGRAESMVREQIERLREYRQAIITAAVTGQLNVEQNETKDRGGNLGGRERMTGP